MADNSKLKVGVIGTGALGRHHSRLYAQNPAAEMVGIFDVMQESAQRVGEEFGLKVFPTWQALAEKCDALSVAVPAVYHASTTLPLMEMGKHILLEKPIDSTVDGAAAMVETAEKNALVFGVGHVERFNPAMDYLLECGKEKIRFIKAERLAPYPPARPGMHRRGTEVSVVLDLMIHDIDLVLTLIDSDVVDFDVIGAPVLSDSEDMVNARIKFRNGSCADITAGRICNTPARTVQVFKDDSITTLDFGQHCGKVSVAADGNICDREINLTEKNALAEELDDFIQTVLKSKADGKVYAPRVSGRQALKALQLATAIELEARRFRNQYRFF